MVGAGGNKDMDRSDLLNIDVLFVTVLGTYCSGCNVRHALHISCLYGHDSETIEWALKSGGPPPAAATYRGIIPLIGRSVP